MSRLLRSFGRLRAYFFRGRLDAELDAELAAHIDLAVDEYIERGMSTADARRRALMEFGGLQQAREQQREARGLMHLDILLQDLKYTLRTLGRDPGFTTVAVLILALAIGANIAVFSVVNTLMLRPLPFPSAHQLAWIAPPPTKCGLSCATYSTDAYDEFRTYSRSYQDVTGYFAFSGPDNLSLKLGSAPITATSIDVIANFFQVLGVQPAMGRVFRDEDARNGAIPRHPAQRCMVATPVQRRSGHHRQSLRHERPPDHRHRRSSRLVRLRSRLRSRRQSRRPHPAQSLWPAAQLGQHHHHDRPSQARHLPRAGERRSRARCSLPCAGTTSGRRPAATTRAPLFLCP